MVNDISTIHEAIASFLQEKPPVSLIGDPDGFSPDSYNKAGVVPFIRHEGGHRFYVMKPHFTMPQLGAPPFQICKGTRMHYVIGAGWRDVKPDTLMEPKHESLVQTALREGIEELGLKLSNVSSLYDLGPYEFSSATTGRPKRMWLFAAKVVDSNDMLPDSSVEHSTSERQWLSAGEFLVVGRGDHSYILEDMEVRLGEFVKD